MSALQLTQAIYLPMNFKDENFTVAKLSMKTTKITPFMYTVEHKQMSTYNL